MSEWVSHPFKELFAAGGEDTAWGADRLAAGKDIIFDIDMAVRHTHRLTSFSKYIKQIRKWRRSLAEKTTGELNRSTVFGFRDEQNGYK